MTGYIIPGRRADKQYRRAATLFRQLYRNRLIAFAGKIDLDRAVFRHGELGQHKILRQHFPRTGISRIGSGIVRA